MSDEIISSEASVDYHVEWRTTGPLWGGGFVLQAPVGGVPDIEELMEGIGKDLRYSVRDLEWQFEVRRMDSEEPWCELGTDAPRFRYTRELDGFDQARIDDLGLVLKTVLETVFPDVPSERDAYGQHLREVGTNAEAAVDPLVVKNNVLGEIWFVLDELLPGLLAGAGAVPVEVSGECIEVNVSNRANAVVSGPGRWCASCVVWHESGLNSDQLRDVT